MVSFSVLAFIIINIFINAGVNAAENETVAEAFHAHEVVPDVIPVAPALLATVDYISGVEANLGNELTPTQVKDVPVVAWDAEADKFYTLALTDPDAPTRANPEFAEWHHWLVGNIPGENITDGETLTQYAGSGPSKGSGLHRYVFLVYEQPSVLDFDEPRLNNTSGEHRANFSIAQFAEKYNLNVPVAGNFYQAQYDEYVDVLYEQMGITAGEDSAPDGVQPLSFCIVLSVFTLAGLYYL